MKRRNLFRNTFLFIFAFIFGYSVKKEDESLVLQRIDSNMVKDTIADEIKLLTKDIGDISELGSNPSNIIKTIKERGLNVKDFGAKGDGLADDSYPIKRAIEHILLMTPNTEGEKTTLYFPPGIYHVLDDKIFSNFNFANLGISQSVRKGITFKGAGRKSSIIKLITNGNEKWFYDNESIDTQKFQQLNFEHIGFQTDDTKNGNGFKQWSQGGEKQFKFFCCDIHLAKIMQFEGKGNADLNRFLLCSIRASEYAFVFNNNQAVSTELISCDTYMEKGLVHLLNRGGGSFKVILGDYEMHPHPTDTTDHYFFKMDKDPNIGQGNCDYNFTDIRFEIHGANKKLVNTTLNNKQLNINFTRCQFGTVSGGSREVVYVTPTKRILFENCILNDAFTYKVEGIFSSSNGTPSGAQLIFLNCDVGRTKNLHERIVKVGDVFRVVAENCFRQSSTVSMPVEIQDFDFGWENIAPSGISAKKKIAPIKQAWVSFPNGRGDDRTLTLPINCYIVRIFIKKPVADTTSRSYNMKIGSMDKSTLLGESGIKAHNKEHIIDLKDIGVLPFNQLKLWGEGDAIVNQAGGTAYVEYI
ncbi:glycosyl hydrolase family 28-related protein [Peribacillus frigoritolerans]|uniref:glycosyl hydrolase family 28-related protein n=1 Tax=Peribacillus frigoritolerans TaxID=450367 RepID=UPI003CFCA1F9